MVTARTGLLEPGIFHSRHRKRVFELVDVFLRSTYLPGYLAAAFAKRCEIHSPVTLASECIVAMEFETGDKRCT